MPRLSEPWQHQYVEQLDRFGLALCVLQVALGVAESDKVATGETGANSTAVTPAYMAMVPSASAERSCGGPGGRANAATVLA